MPDLSRRLIPMLRASVALLLLGAAPAMAQHVTGQLGSPNATTTLRGNQLPPPAPKFGGVISTCGR